MRNRYTAFILSLSSFILSCSSDNVSKNRSPIVFGDSTLIVTETDPQYLSNNVQDIVPQKRSVEKDTTPKLVVAIADTVAKPIAPAEKTNPTETEKPVSGKGLDVPFKSLNLFIAGVEARAGKNIDWKSARGASYILEEGELSNKILAVKEGNVQKVMQRTQTVVMLKTPSGNTFKLSSLPSYTSEWELLKGGNGKFTISNTSANRLKYEGKFSPASLKDAAHKLARANRISKKEEKEILESIRTVKSPNQAPLSIALQSVVWKISAKDAKGNPLERELRIDINR